MNFVFSNRAKIISFVLIAIGVIALVTGIFTVSSDRIWSNLLINGFYFMGISLGALFFYALSFATETAWAVTLRRVMEGVFSFIPAAAAVLIIVFIGATMHWNHIYHWMDEATVSKYVAESTIDSEHPTYFKDKAAAQKAEEAGETVVLNEAHYDELIANKTAYLNTPFFWIRTIIYIAAFIIFARWFRKRSLKEDETGDVGLHFKGYQRGALFLVIFAVFSSTMSWDWIMSIDTHWFSTLFGWYVFSGMWVSAMNIIAVLSLYLISKGYLKEINSSHIHDLGKWIFALSFLWTYLWFSQFMLIWYSNIPEEVTYFVLRIEEYRVPFFGMMLINFIVPMVFLMSRDAKRNPRFLIFVGTIVFIGHFLDTYMLVTPGVHFEHWEFGFVEIGMFMGFTGLFINRVLAALTKAPLVPKESPYLEESLHHSI